MNGRRVLLISNPAAGRSRNPDLPERVGAILDAAGDTLIHRRTGGAEEALHCAENADREGFDVVAAAGGDGTVALVLTGLLRSRAKATLAILPFGTANLTARALSIPSDLDQALHLLSRGKSVSFDAGYVPDRDRYFLISAGIGHPARIIRGAGRRLKRRLGFLAYVFSAARDLGRLRNVRIDLVVDGVEHSSYGHTILVMNIGDFGDLRISLGPGINPHDGLIDLAIVGTRSVGGYLLALSDLFRMRHSLSGRHFVPKHIRYFKGRRVSIRTLRPLPVQLDGELAGTTPLDVEVIAKAIRILVPPEYPGGEG